VVEAIESGVARYIADVVHHVDAEHSVVASPERVGGFTDTAALEAMEAVGARVHLVPMRRSPIDHRNATAVVHVRRLIRRTRPHVTHGHSSIGGVVARLAATGTGAARVYTPNGLLPSRAALTVERMLGRLTDGFVAVSESESALARRLRLAPARRITVIPNGIDLRPSGPPVLDLRGELGVDPSAPLVGSIARLAPQKAPEVYIRACARVAAALPEARFVLIGDGPQAGIVAHEIRAAELDGRFLHVRGVHGAATLMGELDVFALSSRYEGGSFAPLEAMRAGIPVVLTDVVGNRDTVEHGRSGFLVPPDDPSTLAAAIQRLLDDAELRRRVGEEGQARVAACFDVRLMADRLEHLYKSVVSERAR